MLRLLFDLFMNIIDSGLWLVILLIILLIDLYKNAKI